MDQQKIGGFLKELRQEKQMTQEQLAEQMGVSRRTVSRWETGNNLPALSVIIELADFYDVDLNEIFRGERRKETMDTELKDTLLQAAEYSEGIRKNNQKNAFAVYLWLYYICILLDCSILRTRTNI